METARGNMDAQADDTSMKDLAQLLTAARANTVDAMERLLVSAQSGDPPQQAPSGTEHLLFTCAGTECAVPLSSLREVLPTVPRTVHLPFAPEWMLGIFPLRNEMVGLVDPVPLLTSQDPTYDGLTTDDRDTPQTGAHIHCPALASSGAPAMALVVGSVDRCLAWAVESVGAIALAQDDAMHGLSDEVLRELPFARRYVVGMYEPRDTSVHALVLNAEKMLSDLLDALDMGSEGHRA